MTANAPGEASPSKTPWLGPTALLVISMVGLFAVFWGYLNPPDVRIQIFDAGPLSDYAIDRLVEFPEDGLYLVGMSDGRIRALDMRVEQTGCIAEWHPGEEIGRAHNPAGQPGVFRDPCDGATWSMVGNAISGTDHPLRTPVATVRLSPESQVMHVYVEVINP